MKKRIVSMLLAIVMVVGLLPTTAFAAESVAAQDLVAGDAVTIGHTLYTNAGTTTLTLTPDGENNVTVSGVTPPSANDLTYNGGEQALVSEGVVTDGTMEYALGNDGTTAPTEGWTTNIPTGRDAGIYYVWYKAGSSMACVEVTVEKKTVTVSAGNYLVSKFYDGTTVQGVQKSFSNLNIEGILTNDIVQVTVTLPEYTNPNVGEQSKMTIGLLLLGDKAVNYKLNTTSLEVDCEILPLPLEVTAKSYVLYTGSAVPDLAANDAYTITGFKDGMTADSMGIATPILSYNARPDMSKAGTYSINVDVSRMSTQNYEVTAVNGTLKVVKCDHTFTDFDLGTVNTENDSIFAKCSNGCEEYKVPAPVLTLIAPENAVYEQGLGHTASLAFDSQLGDQSSENIVYGPADKLTEGSAIDAGTYTASYTYNDLTASVSYEVAPRPLTIKAKDKSVYVNDSAPEYTYIVDGWGINYNAEDERDHTLSGVTVSCDSADLTSAGSYEITLSGNPVVNGYNVEEGEYDVSANYSFTMMNGTLTVINDSAPGGGGGGGGYTPPSTPSTPPAQSVTVPISGDTNTIHVGASVSGDKATVRNVDLNTGGGPLEVEAPAIADTITTPDGKPEITDPRRGLAATTEDAEKNIEKAIPGVFEPETVAPAPDDATESQSKSGGLFAGIAVLLAALAIGGGYIYFRKRKEAK